MDKKIVIVSLLRLASTRVPKKLLELIGDWPLCYWSLSRIDKAAKKAGIEHKAIIWPGDEPLIKIVNDLGIDVIERSYESAMGETVETIYEEKWIAPLREKYNWVAIVNACRPFLEVDSIVNFLNKVKSSDKNLLGVFKRRGWVWNEKYERVIGKGETTLNTKTNAIHFVPAHCYYAYPIEYLGKPIMINDPELIEIEENIFNSIDIDTPQDLQLARAMYSLMKDKIGTP